MLIPLLRTVILFIVISIAMRVLGKRQIGEMEPSELIVTVMLGELAAVPMQDLDIPMSNGIVPMVTLVFLEMLLSYLFLESRKLRAISSGTPEIVVCKGKIIEDALQRARITLEELLKELRLQGEQDITALQYVVLETNGQLSIIPKQGEAGKEGLYHLLIADGQIQRDNLKRTGKSEEWLIGALHERKVTPEKVFYMAVSDSGRLIWQQKEKA